MFERSELRRLPPERDQPSPVAAHCAFGLLVLFGLRHRPLGASHSEEKDSAKKIVTIRAGRALARPYRLTITTLGRKQTNCRQNLRVRKGQEKRSALAPDDRCKGASSL